MLTATIRQINWLDIAILILFLKICITSLKNGLPAELFKLLGAIFSVYLSMHYYTALSAAIRRQSSFAQENLPVDLFDFASFLALAILGYIIFTLLRILFSRFIKMEAAPHLDKRGGLVLGIGRAFLTVSLLAFMLAISGIGYLERCVKTSYLAKRLFSIAPSAYTWVWNAAASKFMAQEEFNTAVPEVEKDLL